MKGKIGIFVLLGLFALALGGCASSMTAQKDMFLAPNFAESEPEKIASIVIPLPEKLDVADSAFLFDMGINTPSYSWKAIVWKKVKNKQKIIELVAVRLEIPNERPGLIVSFPGNIKDYEGSLIAVPDHGGKRLYNRKGEFIYAPEGWRKVKTDDYPGFFTVINAANTMEVVKGAPDYEGLMDYYKQFRAIEVMQIRDSVYRKYGIPLGSALTEEQLERVEKDPAVDKIKEFLFDKWFMVFTYPLLSPTDYGAFILVAKVFQIPSVWWKDDLNKPGYMDRQLTAGSAFDMIQYYADKYGGFTANGNDQNLPEELRADIKRQTGKDFTTYSEYNAWVVEENSKSK